MDITLNNKPHSVDSETLQQLIEELNIETKGVAIGVNSRVINRSVWGETTLRDGDKIVIVSAVFGG